MRVWRVLAGVEEGPAGVDGPGRLYHFGKVSGIVPKRVCDVLLDIDHRLVEDRPNDEVNQLSAVGFNE